MTPFPLLISIPHGGTAIPEELIDNISIREKWTASTPYKGIGIGKNHRDEEKVCSKNKRLQGINNKDLFDDMDPFTKEIYDLDDQVLEVVAADIARAFVDLNRSPGDLPPANPDGIIKSMTCYKKAIYIKGKEPDERMRQTLINKYYLPYHRRIQEIIAKKEIHLALDCHSMAASPPPIAPDKGKRKTKAKQEKRPLICLGNAHGKACSREIVEKLAACFREAFLLEKGEVSINHPFAGGYITRTYGNNPVPWVQVEMNRSLYLAAPWFNSLTLQVDNHRLTELNNRFKMAVELYFNRRNHVTLNGGK